MLLLAILAASPTLECKAFAARADEPVAITTEIVTASALGGIAEGSTSPGHRTRFRVGELVYEGHGVTMRSSDPRFAEIALDEPARHPCGYDVDMPSGWNANDTNLQSRAIIFRRPPEPDAAAQKINRMLAERLNAPPKPGMRASVSSASSTFFLGLLHPEGTDGETMIVAYRNAPQTSARILARLPMRFDTISTMPDLHSPRYSIYLDGRRADGAIDRVVLELSQSVRDALARDLAAPR